MPGAGLLLRVLYQPTSLHASQDHCDDMQSLKTSCQIRLSSMDSGTFLSAIDAASSSAPQLPTAGTQRAQVGSNYIQEAGLSQPDFGPLTQPPSRLGPNDRGPHSPSRAALVNKLRIPAGQLHRSDSPKGLIKAHGSLSSSLQRGQSGSMSPQQQAHVAAVVELQVGAHPYHNCAAVVTHA